MTQIIFKTKTKKKRLSTPIIRDGKVTHVIDKYPQVDEWIDPETGEIFSRKDEKIPILDLPLLALQREFVLSELSPATLDFAKYVLGFRNKRGGITPCLSELSALYSIKTGTDRSNIGRLAKNLLRQGVLESSQLCSKLFMIFDKKLTYQEHVVIERNLIRKATHIETE